SVLPTKPQMPEIRSFMRYETNTRHHVAEGESSLKLSTFDGVQVPVDADVPSPRAPTKLLDLVGSIQLERYLLMKFELHGAFVGCPLADAPALASELPASNFDCIGSSLAFRRRARLT
ncbi:MAG: hypothetical protein ABIV50_14820, partial [Opitutus sp.]